VRFRDYFFFGNALMNWSPAGLLHSTVSGDEMSFSAFRCCIATVVGLLTIPAASPTLRAAVRWIEGEKPVKSHATHHPWWYEKVHRDQLSGGDFLANWGATPGEAEYAITAPQAGSYEFWVGANPSGTKLSYQLSGGQFTEIDLNKEQRDRVNLAADDKADVRFMAWAHVGSVKLQQGANTIVFRMHSRGDVDRSVGRRRTNPANIHAACLSAYGDG
jgi:hypothetical protein